MPLSDRFDVLLSVTQNVGGMGWNPTIDKGQTLAQIKAARPSLDFDGRYGSTTGGWTTDMFIEAVYRSLQNKK